MHCRNCCLFIAAAAAAALPCPFLSALKDRMRNVQPSRLQERLSKSSCNAAWESEFTHGRPHMSKHSELRPRQLSVERPRATVTPFLFLFPPEGGKNTPVYVCFSYYYFFCSRRSSFLKSLSLWLKFCPLSVSAVGMEADGSWRDGGFVLTAELMWPRGCRPCMPDPMAHNAKCFIVEAGWEKPGAASGELRRDTGCTGSQTERCKMERDASSRRRRKL